MEHIRLFIPLIGVAFGIFIKLTKNEQYASAKKYWLLLIIPGILLFIYRLNKYLG